MAKHRTSGGANSVTNEINTLKDGVGRQAPSKRMPTEAQEIINCFVTLEKSIEKRNGMQAVLNEESLTWDGDLPPNPPVVPDSGSYSSSGVIEKIAAGSTQDAKYIWFELSSDNLFLIQILLSSETWETAVADNQEIIKIIKVNGDGTWTLDYTITAGSGDITKNNYDYLMYGTRNYNDRIKYVNAGADILLLNSEVYAGFSSSFNTSNNKWCLHFLNGGLSSVEDIKGRKISYYPAGARDPESESRIYQIDSFYFRGDRIWTTIGTDSANGVLTRWGGVFQAIEDRDTTVGAERPQTIQIPDGAGPGNYFPPIFSGLGADPYGDGQGQAYTRNGWKLLRYVKEIEAEYNTNVEELNSYPIGAAVNSFRDLPFPPRAGEVRDRNFIWWYEYPGPFSLETLEPADTLAALYDGWNGADRNSNTGEPIGGNNILGRGQIFYCKNAFLEALPGWYRAVDTETAPYYQRVRSPYPYGRFDARRMPQKLTRQSDGTWKVDLVNWDMRLAGTDEDNPGPTAFRNGRQTPIRDIAIFQNRLYLAADDTVFASRLGEYEDFWIADPGNITDSDPIDTTLSTNSYAEVEYMIPFRDQLFIVTNASTQFILTGFDNVVSPFTVEIQPISFYTTSGVTNPVAVGNNVYFANNRRMYMYYPQNVEAGMTVEMTKHCPDYLPESPTGLYVATANDTMFVSSNEDWNNGTFPHELFCYTNRYSGNQMVQNALHKWQLDSPSEASGFFSKHNIKVRSAYSKQNYLYVVYSVQSNAETTGGTYIGRILLKGENELTPRLDSYFEFTQTGPPTSIYFSEEVYDDVSLGGFTSYTELDPFLEAAGVPLLLEDFNESASLPIPLPQPYTFPSGITVQSQYYTVFPPQYVDPGPSLAVGSSGPNSVGYQNTNHLRAYESGVDLGGTKYYVIRFRFPENATSFGCYLSGWAGAGTNLPQAIVDIRAKDKGNDVGLAFNLSINTNQVSPAQFLGFSTNTATFDEVEIFIYPEDGVNNTDFDEVGIDHVMVGYGNAGIIDYSNDYEGYTEAAGPALLVENFESYDVGGVPSPNTFSQSGITIESIMVDDQGNPVVPTTSVSGPSSMTTPSDGLKHYVNAGPINTNPWTLSIKLPASSASFGAYFSGYRGLFLSCDLYADGEFITSLSLGPFDGEEYGPPEFMGFVYTQGTFDELRFTIPPREGIGNFDTVGIDQITVGYNPQIAAGKTWFCVPFDPATVDTVWLGSGWGLNSYKDLPITEKLNKSEVGKPSWVAVDGNYSAPLITAADSQIEYIVQNLEEIEDFVNNPPQPGDLALVLNGYLVYRYVGSGAWILNTTYTWVDYANNPSGENLSATVSFGRKFSMEVELSQQFIRDQNNNVIEGVLSLRQIICRHRNTASYKVLSLSNTELIRAFTEFKPRVKTNQNPRVIQIPLDRDGELVSKILGFSETSTIKITSDSVLPVNITNMTIRGKFRRKNSSFLS